MDALLAGGSGTVDLGKRVNPLFVLYYDVVEDPTTPGTYNANAYLVNGSVVTLLQSSSGAVYVRTHLDNALAMMYGLITVPA